MSFLCNRNMLCSIIMWYILKESKEIMQSWCLNLEIWCYFSILILPHDHFGPRSLWCTLPQLNARWEMWGVLYYCSGRCDYSLLMLFRTALIEINPYWLGFYFLLSKQDEDAFFRDYAVSHKKLSELGCKDTSPAFATESAGSKTAVEAYQSSTAILGQASVGVAVAAVVVALSYIYEAKRKIIKWSRSDNVAWI